jgi:hypothetical protein
MNAIKLPNFLIIGAMKAGTTALHQCLKQHPQIYMSPVKEVGFFVRDNQTLEEYSSFFRGASNEKAIGEASPAYLVRANAHEKIARYLPEVKLIAILRNPADRAYSYFLMRYRQELSNLSDHEISSYFTQTIEKDRLLIQEGLYYTYLQRYLNLFKREQIKICLYDDFKATPNILFRDIFSFLEVDENYQLDNLDTYHNKGGIIKNEFLFNSTNNMRKYFNTRAKRFLPQAVNKKIYDLYNNIKNRNLNKAPKLKSEIRQQLVEIYAKDILNLQNMIERNLEIWLK